MPQQYSREGTHTFKNVTSETPTRSRIVFLKSIDKIVYLTTIHNFVQDLENL